MEWKAESLTWQNAVVDGRGPLGGVHGEREEVPAQDVDNVFVQRHRKRQKRRRHDVRQRIDVVALQKWNLSTAKSFFLSLSSSRWSLCQVQQEKHWKWVSGSSYGTGQDNSTNLKATLERCCPYEWSIQFKDREPESELTLNLSLGLLERKDMRSANEKFLSLSLLKLDGASALSMAVSLPLPLQRSRSPNCTRCRKRLCRSRTTRMGWAAPCPRTETGKIQFIQL